VLLPEWDYRRGAYHADYCRVQPMVAADASPQPLPAPLRRAARRIRDQFQALAPVRVWHRAQEEGVEIDLESYARFAAERGAGAHTAAARLYRDLRGGSRELACLLLADLSLSTDTAVNDQARVIDVVRDSLFLFSEALAASGDRFGLFGFSSRRRDHVRFHLLKGFGERYGDRVRGRIAALRPGFYTRMGAAIRHATALLERQPAQQRLLLILTLRGPLRCGRHAHGGAGGTPPRPAPLLRHHRRAGRRIPAPPVRQRRLRGDQAPRGTAAPPAAALCQFDTLGMLHRCRACAAQGGA
jgi:nitric oxide reductase NorD protein